MQTSLTAVTVVALITSSEASQSGLFEEFGVDPKFVAFQAISFLLLCSLFSLLILRPVLVWTKKMKAETPDNPPSKRASPKVSPVIGGTFSESQNSKP